MKRWQFVLAALAILFAPPFLVIGAFQGLTWPLYWLFHSTSLPAWFGIRGFAITVLGMHVLISAVLMGLLVRRRKRAERWQLVLTAVAVPLAMPFLAFWPLSSLMRLLSSTSMPGWLFGIVAYHLLSEWLLSDTTRYVTISLAALILTSAALIWLMVRERRRIWRRGRLYLLLIALAAVLAFPFVMRYQPAVEAAPDVEMRVVEKPGLLEGVVKQCQVGAEVRGCVYEPLGWVDARTLVYRKWCGGHYTEEGWEPSSPGCPMLYDLNTGKIGLSLIDRAPSYETCKPGVCVTPALAEKEFFAPLYYLPGHFEDPVVSPDGHWVAFTARHVYGPEDLLIISREGNAGMIPVDHRLKTLHACILIISREGNAGMIQNQGALFLQVKQKIA